MERIEETHVTYKCPRDFAPSGRSHGINPRVAVPFVSLESGHITADLVEQVWEHLLPDEDDQAFLDRVHIGLSEAIAKCSQVHLPNTYVRAILIRQDVGTQKGLTFVVDCIPGWHRPIIIPDLDQVPHEFSPQNYEHLGYRRIINATDGFDVDYRPNAVLMFTLSFFDPRP